MTQSFSTGEYGGNVTLDWLHGFSEAVKLRTEFSTDRVVWEERCANAMKCLKTALYHMSALHVHQRTPLLGSQAFSSLRT